MSLAERLNEWLPFLWFLAAVTVGWILWQSGVLHGLGNRITKFGGFGVSFEFTEKSARETRESFEEGLGTIATRIRRKLAADVESSGLQEAFAAIIEETRLKKSSGYRATVHIPDPLFKNRLFQLLDYHPKGRGSGRTFSAPPGIIGRAWRNRKTETWYQGSGINLEQLMQEWGMTEREAEDRKSRDESKLFLAIPLKDTKKRITVGVLYFDAAGREGLGLDPPPDSAGIDEVATKADTEMIEKYLEGLEQEIVVLYSERMAESLADLVEAAKEQGPGIDLDAISERS